MGQGAHRFLPCAVQEREEAAEQDGQGVVLHGFLCRVERAVVVEGGGKEQQEGDYIKR